MRFEHLPFAALSRDTLYAVMALRQRVFVVEQRCAYLDADGADRRATHLLGYDDTGTLVAYARLFAAGEKGPGACAIGRVLTAPEVRGTGVGKALVAEALRCLDAAHPPRALVVISAQSHLQHFYGEFGFVSMGAVYLEDDIPHREMVRA